jgi:hypothetical protein
VISHLKQHAKEYGLCLPLQIWSANLSATAAANC